MGKTDTKKQFSTVTAASKTPLYHQIYLVLRQKIVDGTYPFGTTLSGEVDIAEEYDVSRITAKRALNELSVDGFVKRERGRGTTVSFRPSAAPLESSVEGLLENLLAMGLETQITLLEFDYVGANDIVASALAIEKGDNVQRAVRIRHLDGKPMSHLTTYVPEEIGQKFDKKDLSEKPLLSLLERIGVQVSAANQSITATLADAETASLLGINIGDALLKISRIVLDQDHRPVEFITVLYRPDMYQYRMALSRDYGGGVGTWSPHQ